MARVYYENENPKLVLDMPTANACVFSLSMGRDVNYLLLQIQDEDPSITPPPSPLRYPRPPGPDARRCPRVLTSRPLLPSG